MLLVQIVGMEQLVDRTVVNPREGRKARIALGFEGDVEKHEWLLQPKHFAEGAFRSVKASIQLGKPIRFVASKLYAVASDEAT